MRAVLTIDADGRAQLLPSPGSGLILSSRVALADGLYPPRLDQVLVDQTPQDGCRFARSS